jgi:putative ABC transport system ATP-binding protein
MSERPDSEHLLELREVVKVYDTVAARPALNGVGFTLAGGEFTALMGPSGSGKSTLLNLIAGLDRPSSGRILVEGVELTRMGEADLARFRRDRLGFIFQFFNLLNHLTVAENVMLPQQLAGKRPAEARERALQLLERLKIGDKADQYPGRLSGGQQQSVAIARALANEPVLILADEPTGAIDSQSGEQIMDLMAELNASGQTVLLVTHDAKLAARYARRVISLLDGEVVGDTVLASSPAPSTGLIRLRMEDASEDG